MLEKRRRLREKEKLKHKQYKLKECINKLRGMDGSAFLTLPASLFRLLSALASKEGDASAGGPIVVDDDVRYRAARFTSHLREWRSVAQRGHTAEEADPQNCRGP